jgi:hypothetical protein
MPSDKLLKALLLTACSLAFIMVAVWLHRQRLAHPSAPFAAGMDAAEKITLQADGQAIDLVKNGDVWSVTSAEGGVYRADAEKIKTMTQALKKLQMDDVISERGANPEEFGVDDKNGIRVAVFGKGGARSAEGLFGKQAPDFAHLYFKFIDKPQIYLARGAIRGELGEANVKAWRDRALLNVTEDQILTLYIEGPGFKTPLARSSDTWSLNGKPIDPAPVWGLLGILAHLKADDFIDPVQHPDLSADKLSYASVILQLKDGSSHKVRIGRKDPAMPRYPVAIDQDPNTAWVAEATIKSILQKPSNFPSRH